jgi:paraquat-inducible protein B
MAETPDTPDLNALPQARAAQKRRSMFSLVWLVPLLAVLIGVWLAWRAYTQIGPAFTISFKTAEGIEASKTKIKYKSVDVGVVEALELSPDRSRVLVRARMEPHAADFLVEDTRFWVVRPRVAGGNVEGLGTLLSGAFIGMDVGGSARGQREFTGLEEAPVVTADVPGRNFVLESDTLGSVNVGSPVYFRRLRVGQVESFRLKEDGQGFRIRIFVESPYERFVTGDTRFWEASGFDMKLSAAGLELDTESVVSILIGGIAFQTRGDGVGAESAREDAVFQLFRRREQALAYEDISVVPMQFRFRESVRGLQVGAPVDFRGITLGEVTGIRAAWDQRDQQIYMVVLADIYPERLQRQEMRSEKARERKSLQEGMDLLVKSGFRAQLRTGNLLTGQLYVALDFHRDAKAAAMDWKAQPPELPAVPGSLTGVEENVAAITRNLAAVRFDQIGADLQRALASLDRTLKSFDQAAQRVDREVTPEVKQAIVELRGSLAAVERTIAADAPLQQDLRETLREVSRAAASLRVLTEYLEQHPEALIRGKPEDKP